jgi:predicted TIM-barrel fold metal-dependent hydrolase
MEPSVISPAIDVHVHLHPPRLADAIERHFGERGWRAAHPFTPEAVWATLRAHGIERFCFFSYAHRAGLARDVNRWIADTAQRLPGSIPLGTVHPDDGDRVDAADEALGPLGLAGFKFHCSVQRVRPDDPRLFPVYERVLAANKVVLIHAGTMPYRDSYTGLEPLRRLMERFPALRVCVAHLGAFDHEACLAMTGDFPHLYVDTAMALSPLAEPYVGTAGATTELLLRHQDRILYGSDFPLLPYPYAEELGFAEARGLDEGVRRKIFHDNAARFLTLP